VKPRQRLLDTHRARLTSNAPDPTIRSCGRPKMLPANSCIPRCQRRAPEFRVMVVPVRGTTRPAASRPWPHFGQHPSLWVPALFTWDGHFEDRRLTSASPSGAPGVNAGFTFGPKLLPTPPRERQRFPQHRTPFTSKQPSSGPSNSRWFPPRESSRHLSPLAAVFSGLFALG
jgi:hypothetical protein